METVIIAHAGFLGTPANTVESINQALVQRIGGIELDVRCSREGIPFLSHDRELISHGGIEAFLDELSFTELGEGNFRMKDSLGSPVLASSILSLLRGRSLKLNWDIKDSRAIRGILEILDDYWIERSIFTGLSLCEMMSNRTLLLRGVERGLSLFVNLKLPYHNDFIHSFEKVNKELPIKGVNTEYLHVNENWASMLRYQKLELAVWTVDVQEDIERIKKIGCRYITTNRPDLF